jgi:uracil-DNA glycosylase
MSSPDRAARALRQTLETSALLGVDFAPRRVEIPDLHESPVAEPATAKGEAMEALRAEHERECPEREFITEFNRIVFGEGDPDARLMFIGEAPGADEDRTGRPFVGRAGQLLEGMIRAMGLSRESVYIANVLKVRPPGNATPTPNEVAACGPFLLRQIEIVEPEAIVTLGKPATNFLLETDEALGRLRGRWHEIRGVPVMPTYHPAYLLRTYTPENRGKVWSDLQQVMQRLGLERTPG